MTTVVYCILMREVDFLHGSGMDRRLWARLDALSEVLCLSGSRQCVDRYTLCWEHMPTVGTISVSRSQTIHSFTSHALSKLRQDVPIAIIHSCMYMLSTTIWTLHFAYRDNYIYDVVTILSKKKLQLTYCIQGYCNNIF